MNVAELTYLGMTITNHNRIHENKRTLNLGDVCYHVLSSRLLTETPKIFYKTMFVPLFIYEKYNSWSLILREE
jgi:hypothetical protein